MRFALPACAVAVLAAAAPAAAAVAAACKGVLYLTLDTGSMRHAEQIAAILRRHQVQATFFLANERTPRGDYALDGGWGGYWQARAKEGHAFGSHTWRHGKLLGDAPAGAVRYAPQFGEEAGRRLLLAPAELCAEIRRVDAAFRRMTGRALDPLWRAPGGRTTPNALAAAQSCGYAHVHWSAAGFLGDELPSDRYPNEQLLRQALDSLRDGDVIMAHLGIWSRTQPFAPMLDPLLAGLKERGFCFRTLREHPRFAATPARELVAAGR